MFARQKTETPNNARENGIGFPESSSNLLLNPLTKSELEPKMFFNKIYTDTVIKIEILENDGLINQISYLSFQDLLDFDKNNSLNEVKINKIDKILTISLN